MEIINTSPLNLVAMDNEEDYDSDSTVLLTEYNDKPEKNNVKRRRMSNVCDKGTLSDQYEDENKAPDDVNINRRTNSSSRKKKSNTDRNWHIDKYLACVGDSDIQNNELSDHENPVISVSKQISSECKQNDAGTLKDRADEIICIDSDDDSDINGNNFSRNANNIDTSNKDHSLNIPMEIRQFTPKLKVLKPAAINAQRAISISFERNEMFLNSDASQRLHKNKHSTIRVLKPSVINACRANTSSEENDRTVNKIDERTNILMNNDIEREVVKKVYEENQEVHPIMSELQSADVMYTSVENNNVTDANIALHVENAHTSYSVASNNLLKTLILSKVYSRRNINNALLGAKVNKRVLNKSQILTEPKRSRIDMKSNQSSPDEAIAITAQDGNIELSKVIAIESTNSSQIACKKQKLNAVNNDRIGSEKAYDYHSDKASYMKNKDDARKDMNADGAHDTGELEPSEARNKRETYAAFGQQDISTSFERVTCEESIDKQEIDKVRSEQILSETHTKQSIMQGEQITKEAISNQHTCKALVEQGTSDPLYISGTNNIQNEKEKGKVQNEQETGNKLDEQETSEPHDIPGRNNVQNERQTEKVQNEQDSEKTLDGRETSNLLKIPGTNNAQNERDTEIEQNEQDTNKKLDEQEKRDLLDMPGTNNVQNESDPQRVQNEQDTGRKLDEQETSDLLDIPGTNNVQNKREKGKVQNEQDTGNKLDEQETCDPYDIPRANNVQNEREETEKVQNEQDTDKKLDEQETSDPHDIPGKNNVQNERETEKVQNEQDSGKTLDGRETSNLLDIPGTNNAQNERDTEIEQNEQDTNKKLDEQKTSDPHDIPGRNNVQNEKETEKVQNEQDTGKTLVEQEKRDLLDMPGTNNVQNESDPERVQNEQDTGRKVDEQETSNSYDMPERNNVQNERETEKVQNEQDTGKTLDEQGKSHLLDMPGINNAQNERDTEKVQNEQDTGKKLDEQETSDQALELPGTNNAQNERESGKMLVRNEIGISEGQGKQETSHLHVEPETSQRHDMQGSDKVRSEKQTSKEQDTHETGKIQYEQYGSGTHGTRTLCNGRYTTEVQSKHTLSNVYAEEIVKKAHVNQELNNPDVSIGQDSKDKKITSEAEDMNETIILRDQHLTSKVNSKQITSNVKDQTIISKSQVNEDAQKVSDERKTIEIHNEQEKYKRRERTSNVSLLGFQLEFFTIIKENMKAGVYPELAKSFNNIIQTLTSNITNGTDQIDVQYSCPKCNHVSTFSSSLANNTEIEKPIINSDSSRKCVICPGIRKLYISYVKRFLRKQLCAGDKKELANSPTSANDDKTQPEHSEKSNKRKSNEPDEDTTDSKRKKLRVEQNSQELANSTYTLSQHNFSDANTHLGNEQPDKLMNVKNATLSHKSSNNNQPHNSCSQEIEKNLREGTQANEEANSLINNRIIREVARDGNETFNVEEADMSKTKNMPKQNCDANIEPLCENTPEKLSNKPKTMSKTNTLNLIDIANEPIKDQIDENVSNILYDKENRNENHIQQASGDDIENNDVCIHRQTSVAKNAIPKALIDCFAKLKNSIYSKVEVSKKVEEHPKNNISLPVSAPEQKKSIDKLPECRTDNRADVEYKCHVCSCIYVCPSKYLYHLRVEHNIMNSKIPENYIRRNCKHCDQIFKCKESFNKHMREIHPGKYTETVSDGENLSNQSEGSSGRGTIKKIIHQHFANTESNKTSGLSKHKYRCKIWDMVLNTDYAARKHRTQKHFEFRNQKIYKKVALEDEDKINGSKNEELKERDAQDTTYTELAISSDEGESTSVCIRNFDKYVESYDRDESWSDGVHAKGETSDDDKINKKICKTLSVSGGDTSENSSASESKRLNTDEDNKKSKNKADSGKSRYSKKLRTKQRNWKQITKNKNTSVATVSSDDSDWIVDKNTTSDYVGCKRNHEISTRNKINDENRNRSTRSNKNSNELIHTNNESRLTEIEKKKLVSNQSDDDQEKASDDESIKVSKYAVKKRNERLTKLFGDENETSVLNEINEADYTEQEGRQHNMSELSTKLSAEECTEFEKYNKECGSSNNEEIELASNHETIKASEGTIREKKERIKKLFDGDEYETLQRNKISQAQSYQVVRSSATGGGMQTLNFNNQFTEVQKSNGESCPTNYEEGTTNVETIKASKEALKKKKERYTKSFGDKNECPVSDKNEKDYVLHVKSKQNESSIGYKRNAGQCARNEDCNEKSDMNIRVAKRRVEEERVSEDESIQASEHTVKKRKERIRSSLFDETAASVQNYERDQQPIKDIINDVRTYISTNFDNSEVTTSVEYGTGKDGHKKDLRPNQTKETCSEKSSEDVDVTNVLNKSGIDGKRKRNNNQNGTKARDNDRFEIDMIDNLLEEFDSQANEDQRRSCNEKENYDRVDETSQVSSETMRGINDKNHKKYVQAKTCLDKIQITNVTSVADNIYLFVCQECHYATDFYDNAIRHCQNHFNQIEDPVIYCRVCQINYDASCFEKHEDSHDKYFEFTKITFSYQWLFSNWHILENNDLPLSVVEDIQVKSIYKTLSVKMTVKEDGAWQSALYLCAKCNTCVPVGEIEKHVGQKCPSVNYICSICDRAFLTYDIREHHKIYHRDDISKLFKIIVFNDKNDESFNLNLFEAKARSIENRGSVDIFRCLCGLCFGSLKSFKLHFAECELETNNGTECRKCTVSRRFSPVELEYHLLLHAAKYNFRVQQITFQPEASNDSSDETVIETPDGTTKNLSHVEPNAEDVITRRDVLNDESQDVNEDNRQDENPHSAGINAAEVGLLIKRYLLKDEALSQENNTVENPLSMAVEEDLQVKRDLLKDEALSQENNTVENPLSMAVEEDLQVKRDLLKDEALSQENNRVEKPLSMEVEGDLQVKTDLSKEESVSQKNIEKSKECEHLITIEDSDDDVQVIE